MSINCQHDTILQNMSNFSKYITIHCMICSVTHFDMQREEIIEQINAKCEVPTC
jgi:hypothetical protein